MKLIVAGSRNMKVSPELVWQLLVFWVDPTNRGPIEIVHGNSGAVDMAADWLASTEYIASRLHLKPMISGVARFEPDWTLHGKAAGPIRNRHMANYADELLLIWDGESRGSRSMKEEMLKVRKPVYEAVFKRSREET